MCRLESSVLFVPFFLTPVLACSLARTHERLYVYEAAIGHFLEGARAASLVAP